MKKITGKRAAIYIRVSTDNQEDNTSLATQLADCKAFIEDQGLTHVQTYEDVQSGFILERHGLQAMLADAKAGLFDVLVAWKLDRLTRNAQHSGHIMVLLDQAGVMMAPATETYDESPTGDLLLGVMAFVGQTYRAQLIERVKRAKRATAEQGQYIPGRKPLYGYRWVKSRRKAAGGIERDMVDGLEPDPFESEVVRRVFQHIAEGGSASAIVKSLNGELVPAPLGVEWRVNAVCRMLRNPAYRGEAQALKTKQVAKSKYKKAEAVATDESERVTLNGVIEPLVSAETWQRANTQLASNKRFSPRRANSPERFLLRGGFVFCASCGTPMHSRTEHGRFRYRCRTKPESDETRDCPNRASIAVEKVDSLVWDAVRTVLQDRDWARRHIVRPDAATAKVAAASVDNELDQTKRKIERTVKAIPLVDDPTPLVSTLNALQRRAEALKTEKDRLLSEVSGIAAMDAMFDWQLHEHVQNIDAMTYDARRAVLRDFNVKVTVHPKDHHDAFTLDWAFELPLDYLTGYPDDSVEPVTYTRPKVASISPSVP